jgi:hypothetical protein
VVHQFTDIYFDILSPTCNAPVQSRDPLFMHLGKHSNRDRFDIILSAETISFSDPKVILCGSFFKHPNKNQSQGTKSEE